MLAGAFYLSLTLVPIFENDIYYTTAQEFLFALFGIVTIIFAVKIIDRNKLSSIGFSANCREYINFGKGFLVGGVSITFVFLLELIVGTISVKSYFYQSVDGNYAFHLILRFFGYFCVALLEETFSRGYQYSNIMGSLIKKGLSKNTSILISLFISSLIFGILHSMNPNATPLSTVNLVLIGAFYCFAYILTDSLAAPIGIHFAWNFFQENLFGYHVSGFESYISFIEIEITEESSFLTGGSFGPEGGLIILAGLAAGLFLQYKFLKSNKD